MTGLLAQVRETGVAVIPTLSVPKVKFSYVITDHLPSLTGLVAQVRETAVAVVPTSKLSLPLLVKNT